VYFFAFYITSVVLYHLSYPDYESGTGIEPVTLTELLLFLLSYKAINPRGIEPLHTAFGDICAIATSAYR
jgi:hypothetical protein